jgi:phage terminase large subunit-like protein
MASRRTASSPDCGWTHDGQRCAERGSHFCEPRAAHAVAFFEEILVHTKGRFARQAFILAPWQRDDIVRPLFGEVRWDSELRRYVRLYRVAWIELARKNGKSELLAGVALYLLVADAEEGAEIYGAAMDKDQARKVFDVAMRMVQLSPVLSKAVVVKAHEKRLIYEKTGSYYEVIAADAAGNLGHNPHGIIFDEVLTQRSADLWNALRTAMGTREQPLMLAATTAGNNPSSFAAKEHEYCEKVAARPSTDPTRFVYMRNAPKNADWQDEKNWTLPNPALGDFLSLQALRDEAKEAAADPTKENAFRQFRLNQWVQQSTRWLSLHHWDQQPNIQMLSDLDGASCYGGLDLSSKLDLTALCWTFPHGDTFEALWRFWLPADRLADMDRRTGDKASVWVREGFLTLTEGNVIDYEAVTAQIDADARRFDVRELAFDPWGATQLANQLTDRGLSMVEFRQGFRSMSEPLKEWQKLIISGHYVHAGNPVMRWMADNLVVQTDPAGNLKPDKSKSHEKIDGCVAAVMSLARATLGTSRGPSVYESRGLEMV